DKTTDEEKDKYQGAIYKATLNGHEIFLDKDSNRIEPPKPEAQTDTGSTDKVVESPVKSPEPPKDTDPMIAEIIKGKDQIFGNMADLLKSLDVKGIENDASRDLDTALTKDELHDLKAAVMFDKREAVIVLNEWVASSINQCDNELDVKKKGRLEAIQKKLLSKIQSQPTSQTVEAPVKGVKVKKKMGSATSVDDR
ncbi:MAG: hypothetical protein WCJ70_04895, partial [bacterium]